MQHNIPLQWTSCSILRVQNPLDKTPGEIACSPLKNQVSWLREPASNSTEQNLQGISRGTLRARLRGPRTQQRSRAAKGSPAAECMCLSVIFWIGHDTDYRLPGATPTLQRLSLSFIQTFPPICYWSQADFWTSRTAAITLPVCEKTDLVESMDFRSLMWWNWSIQMKPLPGQWSFHS